MTASIICYAFSFPPVKVPNFPNHFNQTNLQGYDFE